MQDPKDPLTWLILGGNLGNVRANLARARALLATWAGPLVARSSLYRTAAWGMADAPDFLNQVVGVRTPLAPGALLRVVQDVEAAAGRTREEGVRWASRTLDVDILTYGDRIVRTDTLRVPHVDLPNRRFVLVPLVEVAPGWVHPALKLTARALLDRCLDPLTVEKVAD
ncbi:MAG: 2-amino-4-hydroxy-6-hydroxymethyldihydropteridine diphosphokinase [Catalinimonas sp.]